MQHGVSLAHWGWAVHSITNAQPSFELLGFSSESTPCDDIPRGVRILFMKNKNEECIELIEPLRKDSPISALLEKNGATPYHACFSITSKEWGELRDRLKSAGFFEITSPAPAPAIAGKTVLFLFSKQIGLIELLFDE